jgi:hypothetical protein
MFLESLSIQGSIHYFSNTLQYSFDSGYLNIAIRLQTEQLRNRGLISGKDRDTDSSPPLPVMASFTGREVHFWK